MSIGVGIAIAVGIWIDERQETYDSDCDCDSNPEIPNQLSRLKPLPPGVVGYSSGLVGRECDWGPSHFFFLKYISIPIATTAMSPSAYG